MDDSQVEQPDDDDKAEVVNVAAEGGISLKTGSFNDVEISCETTPAAGGQSLKDQSGEQDKTAEDERKNQEPPPRLTRWYLTGLPAANPGHELDSSQQLVSVDAVDPRNWRCFLVSGMISVVVYLAIPALVLLIVILILLLTGYWDKKTSEDEST